MSEHKTLPRWYFGGLASAMAVCFTHPLDLLKVQLQTKSTSLAPLPTVNTGCFHLLRELVKREGVFVLYSGLSASIFRQLLYSTIRFAIYDTSKLFLGQDMNFAAKAGIAFTAGGIGGLVGSPADKINVRMQNDSKLPKGHRYEYKHVFDGLYKVYTQEGHWKLLAGAKASTVRGMIMSVGQIAFYDQIKQMIIQENLMDDNLLLHFTASLFAGGISTALANPVDVVKTKAMSAPPGEYNSSMDVIRYIMKKYGPLGFVRGLIPGFMRIGPQTILTFIFYEQLRINFGYYPDVEKR